MSPGSRGRLATILATGFLLVDAILLALVALWSGRPVLFIPAAVLAGAAGLVLWAWRAQRRRLAEIAATRAALREETMALRELVRRP